MMNLSINASVSCVKKSSSCFTRIFHYLYTSIYFNDIPQQLFNEITELNVQSLKDAANNAIPNGHKVNFCCVLFCHFVDIAR